MSSRNYEANEYKYDLDLLITLYYSKKWVQREKYPYNIGYPIREGWRGSHWCTFCANSSLMNQGGLSTRVRPTSSNSPQVAQH